MRQQHVQMALVHRNIGRLADRAARMVQPFRHIAQLHEILEIVQRRIAPPAGLIAHKGRAVNRGQHQIAATNVHIARRVAGMLGKLRRGGCTKLARKPARNMHPLALDGRARRPPKLQRGRVFKEIHADFFQNGVGVPFDDRQRFFVQDLEIRDVPADEFGGVKADRRAFRPPRGPTAAPCPAPTGFFCCTAHRKSLQKAP